MINSKEHLFAIKKLSANWNQFIYEFCLSKINIIEEYRYDNEAFGSWSIETNNKRIIYDGKDSMLTLQIKRNKDWIKNVEICKNNLTEKDLLEILK